MSVEVPSTTRRIYCRLCHCACPIDAKVEELGKVSQKLGEKMYADMQAQQAGAAGAAGAAEGAAHAGGAQQAADDVVDAEFKEVKKD